MPLKSIHALDAVYTPLPWQRDAGGKGGGVAVMSEPGCLVLLIFLLKHFSLFPILAAKGRIQPRQYPHAATLPVLKGQSPAGILLV